MRHPGHAYLTQPGELYFSGFDGDQRFGIPTFDVVRGERFRVGANGVRPNSGISFTATNTATGALVDLFSTGNPGQGFVSGSQSNCVVHESGEFTVNLPDGRYRVVAVYQSGNQLFNTITDQVTDIVVRAPLPAPPPPPRDPCLRICLA